MPDIAYCNRILKRIAVEVGIDKAVTYHLRRHTFATTNALMQGIRIEVVNRCGFPAGLRRSLDGHSAGVSGKSGEKITCGAAFIFVIIGTSMNVYPAAGLLNYVGMRLRALVICASTVLTEIRI